MSMGQFMATTQFYLHGRNNFTSTGYENNVKKYKQPDILQASNLNLEGKVYMITGANAGIGKEITKYLAAKGASVYMVCRSPDRANAARDTIVSETGNNNVFVLLCDCGLESGIRKMWKEFLDHRSSINSEAPVKLDALVCNAGALLNTRTLTSEGVEVTFASHFLFGTYLLGELALPYLKEASKSGDGRLIAVSSGGMYNTKFPKFEDAASVGSLDYDGQFAYAFAKV